MQCYHDLRANCEESTVSSPTFVWCVIDFGKAIPCHMTCGGVCCSIHTTLAYCARPTRPPQEEVNVWHQCTTIAAVFVCDFVHGILTFLCCVCS